MIPLVSTDHIHPEPCLSPRDGMVAPGKQAEYFDLGRRALELVLFSGRLCDKPHYPDILDLPCGHGRVLRWLRAAYDYAHITACDLDRDGVDFCRDTFRAQGVYSQPDLSHVSFDRLFDLVWCGSLLTHLNEAAWHSAFASLVRFTKEYGVLIFSLQGRGYASHLARGRTDVAENIDKAALLADFATRGFAYQRYFEKEHGDYGVTLTSPEWVGRILQRHPDLILRAYLEEAWGMQDIVILYKRTGHFEPVLDPPPPAPPLTGWRRWLSGPAPAARASAPLPPPKH